jgi:hypothetical protein
LVIVIRERKRKTYDMRSIRHNKRQKGKAVTFDATT